MKKVFAALILLSTLIACASCAHFRGKVNGYYIPGDLKNFTSCRCESEGKEFEVQKKDNYLLVKTDDQTYLLSSGGGALKSEEGIKELSKEQASSALLSAVTESGLIYSAAEKDVYIMTDTSGKYRADAEKFFFAAEKMRHMLKGGREEGFEKLLTPEQKAQLEAKRQARRERKAANAPTERKRPERAVQAGPKLELSAAQKESLGKLRQEQKAENEQAWTNFKAELGSILDDSQRAKLDKLEARQLMRGPRRGGSKEGRPGREKRPAAPTPSAK